MIFFKGLSIFSQANCCSTWTLWLQQQFSGKYSVLPEFYLKSLVYDSRVVAI